MTTPASRLYLALFLPWLAEDAWRLSREFLPSEEELVVFTERQANAVRLSALSRAATQAGLIPGLTLADARARLPALVAIERDDAAEARLLARIVAGCVRYTPMAAAEPPDGAALDITGCTLPFGGEDELGEDLAERLLAGGVGARLGFGDTPQAARARARFGTPHLADLRRLPVAALEAAPEVTTALRRAELRTIGDLACRPRAMLAARFGDLARRLARLLGEEEARISPERPPPSIFALRRFAEPIGRVEDALATIEALAGATAVTLAERHQGGRRFAARLFRCDGHVAAIMVETGRPTRDAGLVARLFRERIDALADPIDPGFGFDLIRLDVGGAEPLAPAQEALATRAETHEPLDALVDRLAARLGAARIARLAPRDSHIPECAAALATANANAAPEWERPGEDEPPMRPFRLLDPPQPIEAVLSEVPDGPPMRFAWGGATHRVVHHEGPERIAAEWWRRRDGGPVIRAGRPRDYYRVEDAAGRRFWLFRHGLTDPKSPPAWYIHGLFA